MARTFQITEVFPELSVADNIRVAVEIARRLPSQAAARRRGAGEVAARVAELVEMGGLADKKDRRVGALSHGDQRATEIMMSLALRPRLLMLDEPTAGMGDQETYDIARLIRAPAQARTSDDHADRARHAGRVQPRRPHHGAGGGDRFWRRGRRTRSPTSEVVQAAYLGKAAA